MTVKKRGWKKSTPKTPKGPRMSGKAWNKNVQTVLAEAWLTLARRLSEEHERASVSTRGRIYGTI